jgi:hypothetical protein
MGWEVMEIEVLPDFTHRIDSYTSISNVSPLEQVVTIHLPSRISLLPLPFLHFMTSPSAPMTLMNFPGNTMTSFIERSGCMLHRLQAGFLLNSENEEDFNRFLQANPHIATLKLTSVTDCFFNRLAIKPEDLGDDMPFLPSLSEFTYSGPRTFSWQAFEQSLWRIEASIGKGPNAPLVGPFYFSLRSEIEILNESLTRQVATLQREKKMIFDISSRQGSWIQASLRHWGINPEEGDR